MWGPQSSAVLVLGIVLAVAAVGGTLVAWSRVRGPAALRVLQRVGLVLLCQLTAVGVVGVTINRLDGFFATWTDVAGILRDVGGAVPTVTASPQVHTAGAVSTHPATAADATRGPFTWSGGLWRAHAHGAASGITGDVLVWTPPGYDPHRAGGYRVLLALSGYPGTPVTTINGLDLPAAVTSRVADGRLPATIVVTASTNLDGRNWDCADVPGGPRVTTWLTHDVAQLVGQSFDVAPGRWTTIGVSTGAYCAVRLAVTEPADVGAAIALSGDDAADSPALAGRLAHANDLRTLVAEGATPPVSLFVGASRQDGTTAADAEALRAAAGHGITTTVHVRDVGGHVWPVWAAMAAGGLDWLGTHEPG
ncbi:MAG: hypothetical protein BGO37_13440 [Cellulomonas sp. 73-92]|uniref:alpha/beta hydrolase n=1 Tax=Cellulomonas sp. 73-92 TaxID=1895740 RepID=UPI00092A70D4|nr:alpha/beta hydrolase-fold protein [Cellulomonas sp. 73-92]OJV82966.1 MAG: hypothetical protein BGO37_13440 [Cellulomonas sp. 73-92]